VTCLLGDCFVANWAFFVSLLLFVRSSRYKRNIIDICRKQTWIPACLKELSPLWKYAWRPKPAVGLIYTTFLLHCNECKTILVSKRCIVYYILCYCEKKACNVRKSGDLHLGTTVFARLQLFSPVQRKCFEHCCQLKRNVVNPTFSMNPTLPISA
jgi:hypothetical protein